MAYRFEGTDLVVDGWNNGIAPDPFSGIADMRNMNISGTPNEASVNFKTLATQFSSFSGTITLTNAGDTVTFSSGGSTFVGGYVITVGSTVGGLTAGIPYYILTTGSPGVFQLSLKYAGTAVVLSADTSTTFATVNMGLPVSRATELKVSGGVPTATYYILDANGRAWVSNNGTLGNSTYWTYMNNTTLANASGQGIVAWKGYLFVFRNAVIDVVSTAAAPLSGDWTYAWKTLNSNNSAFTQSHFSLVGQDDLIYYCDVDVVGSIEQVAGQTFAPGNSATYTYNAIALQLPSLEVATCLAELGVNLLTGGIRNFIYPWNRIAVGFTYPILLPEGTTTRMITASNVTYILAGVRGRIYATNGSNVQEVNKIPDYLTGTNKPFFYWKDAIWNRGKLFMSFSSSSNTAPTTPQSLLGGVWSMDTDSKALQCENILSYGTYAGFAGVLIAQFVPLSNGGITTTGISGEGYYAGWYDGVSAYGVDNFTNASQGASLPYSNYEAYIDSEKIPVGQFLNNATFSNMEFKLSSPLVSGEKIKILARFGLNNSESPIDATAGYALVFETQYAANTISDAQPINWEKVQWVQFRIRTSSTNTSPSYVRLREIRLRK